MNDKEFSSQFQSLLVPQSEVICSPKKNLTGCLRIAKDIVADLYNAIQKWNDSHIRGAQCVKQIAILKSDNRELTTQLEDYLNSLYIIVQNLRCLEEQFALFKSQIRALEKIEKKSENIFLSLNVLGLAKLIESIVDAYREEFKVKEVILENIAHSKNKHEVMFYATCWTLQANITSDTNFKLELILLETGHLKICT
ncbi:unnamed protein product [Phaedon cochleariae]|uniref:Uncharacterized protein n=1 Tax=Phaedon cochleariae TaxID=80249 RepID=A0A9P0GNK1_PHACE|nr:unnamed protein product [Phaedon cochleariae]